MTNSPHEREEALAALVGQIADEYTDRLNRGEPADWLEYVQRHPQIADVLAEVLPGLERLQGSEPGPIPQAALPEPLGDYRILREVGRGGMGVVYEAEQTSLGRRVALKVLPFAATMDARQRQRFQNEARAAACLQHPHIVPVYAVGCERGVYYFAMQFIDGRPLEALIRELRGAAAGAQPAPPREGADSTTDEPRAQPRIEDRGSRIEDRRFPSSILDPRSSPDFRQAAQWGIQAAEALEHAHSLGIVHRDIKPANLLLDGQGNLWVADFGLARTATDSGLTVSGDLLGTLRYMSPEQALAKHGLVDHRTDVYSLGATLYELLTLRPAVDGQDRQEILSKIVFEEPAPPRKVNRAIPAELETVVLKALAKNPAERYPTAQDFADDLLRFLEDRPIQARRPTLLQRARRWARRHRAVVTLAGITAALLTLAALGWLWRENVLAEEKLAQVQAEQQKTEAEQQKTESALRKAEARLQDALNVVDELTRVGQTKLARLPQLENVRREILETALGYHLKFLKDEGGNPRVRWETARARGKVADILDLLGRHAEAEPHLDKGIALLEELVEEFPGAFKYKHDLATAHGWRAELLRTTGRHQEAAQAHHHSLALHTRSAPGSPHERSQQQANLAAGHHNLGLALKDLGRLDEAVQAYRESLARTEELLKEFPREAVYHDRLATVCSNLGQALHRAGQHHEAERLLRRSVARHGKLVAQFPNGPEYRSGLAYASNHLGQLLAETGRLPEADRRHRQALGLWQQLAADFPGIPEYKRELAVSYTSLGVGHQFASRLPDAEKAYRQALALREELAAKHTEVPDHQDELAGGHLNLGTVLKNTDRLDEAESAYLEAVGRWRKLTRKFPARPRYQDSLVVGLDGLGLLLWKAGRYEEAQKNLREALALADKLAAAQPGRPDYREALAREHAHLGLLFLKTGRLAEAEKAIRQALARERQLAHDHPQVPRYLVHEAGSHGNLAEMLRSANRLTEAEESGRRALALREKLATAYPGVPTYQKDLASTCQDLGKLLQKTRPLEEAENLFGRAVQILEKLASDFPEMTKYRRGLAKATHALGHFLRESKRQEEAEKAFRRAVGLFEDLVKQSPAERELRHDLANALNGLGWTLWGAGRDAEAEATYQKALALVRQLADDLPRVADYRGLLGCVLHNLGSLRLKQDQPAEARQLAEQALRHQQTALAIDPTHHDHRENLRNHYWQLAEALARLGEHAGAAGAAEELPKVFPDGWEEYHRAAGYLARCAAAADEARDLPAGERRQLGKRYADRAGELFQEALRRTRKEAAAAVTVLCAYGDFGARLSERGRLAEADTILCQGCAQAEALVAAYPQNPDCQKALAAVLLQHAGILDDLGQLRQARANYRRAIKLCEGILAGPPPHAPEVRRHLCGGWYNLGLLLKGQAGEAEAAYRQALAVGRQLALDFPDQAEHRNRLGCILNNLGQLVRDRGAVQEARALAEEAIASQQAVLKLKPKHPPYLGDLRKHYLLLSNILAASKDHAGAVKARHQAVDIQEQVAVAAPGARNDRKLAGDYHQLGELLTQGAEGRAQAVEVYRRGVALRRQLVKGFPADADYRRELGGTLNNLSTALRSVGETAEARLLLEEAVGHQQLALKARPQDVTSRTFLRNHYTNLAQVLADLKQHGEAAAVYEKAAAVAQGLAADLPRVAEHRVRLGGIYLNQAAEWQDAGKFAEADKAYRQALEILERLAKDFPGVGEHRRGAAVALINLAGVHRAAERPGEAQQTCGRAVGLLEQLVKDFPAQAGYRGDLVTGLRNWSLLLSGSGWHPEAQKAVRRLLELEPDNADMLNHLAWLLATCPGPKYRDGVEAVRLAKKAVALAPKKAEYWGTLGTAHYRAGDARAAVPALEKAIRLRPGDSRGTTCDRFFLAMAHWQMGEKGTARTYYDRAVRWLESNREALARDRQGAEEVRRFRAEAEEVLDGKGRKD